MPLPSEPSPPSPPSLTAPFSPFAKPAVSRLLFGGLLFLSLALLIARKGSHSVTPHCKRLPAAVYYHRVRKGMPPEAVERSCGRPEYVEQRSSLGEEGEAWFYSASDGQIQIDFDQGKVLKVNRQ